MDNSEVSSLRVLVDSFFQVQKLRVQTSNRMSAIQKGNDVEGVSLNNQVLSRMMKHLEGMETDLEQRIGEEVRVHVAWSWLKTVKGVGPILSGKMLSFIDIDRADTISALWRYAGYGVIDGKIERPVKGEKLHYNKRLKSTMYLVAVSFLKSKGKFSELYYREKDRLQIIRTADMSDLQVHYRALRKMIKVFLGCLWLYWRQAEGLPIRNPYSIDYLNHSNLYVPYDFEEIGESRSKLK